MDYSISQIAKALGTDFDGDGELKISSAAEPSDADENSLALAMNQKYLEDLKKGSARAAVVMKDVAWKSFGLKAVILVDRPRHAISRITKLLDNYPISKSGVHPTAIIDSSAVIDKTCSIGAFCVIGANVEIEEGGCLGAHVVIGNGVKIGNNAIINNRVVIEHDVVIGNQFRAQSGSVIGSDGFSFVTREKSDVEEIRKHLGKRQGLNKQSWMRIHSLGSVAIGDDVEIGANVTIDRGTVRNTSIGDRSKLDNLVHVGHNVEIGSDCLICGQVGIAGSAVIGNRVVLGGQCGVNDNIFVGDDVIAGGATKIFTNAPKGRVLLGYPAVKMETHISMQKALRRLPRLFKKLS